MTGDPFLDGLAVGIFGVPVLILLWVLVEMGQNGLAKRFHWRRW